MCMSFYSYSTKSTVEVVQVAGDEGVWCFAVTQLRALRMTCGWQWDARMCGCVGAIRGVPLQPPPLLGLLRLEAGGH